MSVIVFLSYCFLVFSAGLGLSIVLNRKNALEIWGLSWLLGTGWCTFIWFIMYQVGSYVFTLSSLLITTFIFSSLIWIIVFGYKKKDLIIAWQALRTLQVDAILKSTIWSALLVILLLFIIFHDIFWPVTDWDSLALYDFRAKVMTVSGSLEEGKELGYFFQYPLFTSALHAATYLCGVPYAKIWYALLYQAATVLFYVVLRKKQTKFHSLIGTLFFATSPLIFAHSMMAYTNLPYVIFASFGLIYLWIWWASKNETDMLIGSMLVGLSTWIRISEPFYYVAVIIIVSGMLKQIINKQFSISFIATAMLSLVFVLQTRQPWDNLINSLYEQNLGNPLSTLSLIKDWNVLTLTHQVGSVTIYLFLYSLPVYSSILFLALITLVNDLKNKQWQVLLPWITIGTILSLIFTGTLLISFWLESWARIGDSVTRMSMFLIPLILYTLFTSPSWNNKKDSL